MNFQAELLNIKKSVDRELERFFARKVQLLAKEDPISAEALGYVGILALSGGKRLRPALFLNIAKIGKNKNESAALKIAAALELIHIYLLIHDDIMDLGSVRHGQMTAHLRFALRAKKFFGARNVHFGVSMAIAIGDMLYALAVELIAESGLEAKENQELILLVQKVVARTVVGQIQDISIENKKKASEKDVLAMYCNKTAQYTFQGPLKMGLVFARNKDIKIAKALAGYAMNLGIAFQIRDDIIGVFGNKHKTGKEVGIDIAEGKKTLLVISALRLGAAAQKRRISALLGKKNISWKEIKEFQKIMLDCGALEYAKTQVGEYTAEARKCLNAVVLPTAQKEFLLGIAEYLEERES